MIFLIFLLVSLFLALILFAARRLNQSDTADIINQSIVLSSGGLRKK